MDKQKILNFIKGQKYAVVSSVTHDYQPHSALVAFSETDDLEIVYGTHKDTRKVKNLEQDPKVSIVIGLDYPISVQLEGSAEVIADSESKKYAEAHTDKHPTSKKYMNDPGQVYIKFTPKWARYTDLGKSPAETLEVTF